MGYSLFFKIILSFSFYDNFLSLEICQAVKTVMTRRKCTSCQLTSRRATF